MKPAPFTYCRPETSEEIVALLGEFGDDARILAGGQSLVAMMNMRLTQPRVLIDIAELGTLDGIRTPGNNVEIGAAARQATLESWPDLRISLPLAAAALPHIGHFQTRNRGTVCGSIAHADPGAELPLLLATLNGQVMLRGPRGRRTVSGRDFFIGMLATVCGADEFVESVRFPTAAPGTGYAFDEIAPRHGDFAIVAVAAAVGSNGVTVGVGGVADRPVARDWADLHGADLDDALNDLAWSLDAVNDHHASAEYRRGLVRRVGRRVIEAARP